MLYVFFKKHIDLCFDFERMELNIRNISYYVYFSILSMMIVYDCFRHFMNLIIPSCL